MMSLQYYSRDSIITGVSFVTQQRIEGNSRDLYLRALGNKVDENEHLAHHGMVKIKEALGAYWSSLGRVSVCQLSRTVGFH